MRTSDLTTDLVSALKAAQAKFLVIEKKHEATVQTRNGREYRYRYADLADTWAAVKEILNGCGITVTQFPDLVDGVDVLTTRVSHDSGQWMEASMRLHPSTTPQGQGSSITYARRYALVAALGIIADEDDDGNAATRERQGTPRDSGGRAQGAQRSAGATAGARNPQARLYALCRSNALTPAIACEEVLGFPVSDTRRLTDEQANQVLDDLDARGVKFSR